jgi:hypothetical protein
MRLRSNPCRQKRTLKWEENQIRVWPQDVIDCRKVEVQFAGIFRLEGSNLQFDDKTTGLT